MNGRLTLTFTYVCFCSYAGLCFSDFLIGFRSVPSSSPETDFPSFSTPLFSDGSTSLASTVEASKPTSIGDSFPTNSRTKTKQYIIPSRVVHPRFEVRRGGKGKYVLCRRETVADLLAGKGKGLSTPVRFIYLFRRVVICPHPASRLIGRADLGRHILFHSTF